MKQGIDLRTIKLITYGLTISFLVIHTMLFGMFHYYGVIPMARFNIFSMVFYITMPILLYKNKLRLYVILVYLEVVIHMAAAVFYTGTDGGFHFVLIGLNLLVFYAEYIGRTLKLPNFYAIPLAILGMVAYLGSIVADHYHTPAYSLPENISFRLQIVWGIVIFGLNIAYFEHFIILTMHSEKALFDQVIRDKLTELPNRYYMSEYLNKIVSETEGENYWAAILDIDDFKKVNDTYGHNYGDYVLKTVARIMQNNISGGEICRWGGEEFLLVGRMDGDVERQRIKLEKLRKAIEEYVFSFEGQSTKLTVTIGAACQKKDRTLNDWIEEADQGLYFGKKNGKNQVVFR